MSKHFTLRKKERLKSRKSIDLLFAKGKKFTNTPYRILYMFDSPDNNDPILFGVGVSSKLYKRAVDRNRIKRLTREAYRLQKNRLQQKLADNNRNLQVFFVYNDNELPGFEQVYKSVGSAILKLEKLL